jgi:hypothetical protein
MPSSRRAFGAAALALLTLVVAACGSTTGVPTPGLASIAAGSAAGDGTSPGASGSAGAPAAAGSPTSSPATANAAGTAAHAVATVAATDLSVRLPAGLSRTVVAPDGSTLLVMGGLGVAGTSGTILRLDPAAGTVTTAGRLGSLVHDAAGALAGNGTWLVLGGGVTVAVATVQGMALGAGGGPVTSTDIGALPVARADGGAVSVAGRVVVIGGGRGGVANAAVWATRDGRAFTRIATLATAVRYGAAAVAGGRIYLFGGTSATGDTSLVQLIDPASGTVRVIGHLPRTLTEAAAFVIDGRIYIAGGMHAGAPVDTILAFDLGTGRFAIAGRLPEPRADAAVAVLGGTAYLVGGETGRAYLDTVVAVRPAS